MLWADGSNTFKTCQRDTIEVVTETTVQNMPIQPEERNDSIYMEAVRDNIQLEEVTKAIGILKNGKAPGVDCLKTELYKCMGKD